jgi:hypothetical protein
MYRYRYINKHSQFGYTDYTLILEDLEEDPEKAIRIEKSFNIDPQLIDSDFLYQEARKEIIRVLSEKDQEVPMILADVES